MASDKTNRLLMAVHLVAACLLLTMAGCGTESNAANRKASATFAAIRADVLRGDYETTPDRLAKFIDAHPKHPDASRAGLFIGKCFLALGDLPAARQAFQTTVDTYPGTLEEHKCRYKLAVVTMLEGDREDAIRQFAAMADEPDGPLAPEAAAMAQYLRDQAN